MIKYLLLLVNLIAFQAFAQSIETDEQILSAITPTLYYKSVNLTINPVSNLNNLSQREIYNQRQKQTDNSYFFPENHQPSSQIFSQIISGKPWKSISAYHCTTKTGDETIGNSFVSREINNPDILIGLSRDTTVVLSSEKKRPSWFCDEPQNHLLPSKLYYDTFHNILSVEYNLDAQILPYKLLSQYVLSDLNARDLGYNYIHILKTENISMLSPDNITQTIGTTKDYIHLGTNCSAAGGCNNVSPSKPETVFRITDFPAQLVIKLWEERPTDKNSSADIYVNILIKSK